MLAPRAGQTRAFSAGTCPLTTWGLGAFLLVWRHPCQELQSLPDWSPPRSQRERLRGLLGTLTWCRVLLGHKLPQLGDIVVHLRDSNRRGFELWARGQLLSVIQDQDRLDDKVRDSELAHDRATFFETPWTFTTR